MKISKLLIICLAFASCSDTDPTPEVYKPQCRPETVTRTGNVSKYTYSSDGRILSILYHYKSTQVYSLITADHQPDRVVFGISKTSSDSANFAPSGQEVTVHLSGDKMPLYIEESFLDEKTIWHRFGYQDGKLTYMTVINQANTDSLVVTGWVNKDISSIDRYRVHHATGAVEKVATLTIRYGDGLNPNYGAISPSLFGVFTNAPIQTPYDALVGLASVHHPTVSTLSTGVTCQIGGIYNDRKFPTTLNASCVGVGEQITYTYQCGQ